MSHHIRAIGMYLCVIVKGIYRPLYVCNESDSRWIFSSIDYNLKPSCHSVTQVICIALYSANKLFDTG